MTPFHIAAKNGHFEVCKLFIDNVEDKNPMANFLSPLHLAAYRGHFEICKMIIDEIEDKNLHGKGHTFTPLDYAIKFGHHQIADYIRSKIEGSKLEK